MLQTQKFIGIQRNTSFDNQALEKLCSLETQRQKKEVNDTREGVHIPSTKFTEYPNRGSFLESYAKNIPQRYILWLFVPKTATHATKGMSIDMPTSDSYNGYKHSGRLSAKFRFGGVLPQFQNGTVG